ncbi:hypothetical protein [Sinomonas sp. G460-2]|uniref:hypothetical protein n=1 Tax=Sinomonas sp. G460-2 TaxID=3393464 RepID=UPI0039F061EB
MGIQSTLQGAVTDDNGLFKGHVACAVRDGAKERCHLDVPPSSFDHRHIVIGERELVGCGVV